MTRASITVSLALLIGFVCGNGNCQSWDVLLKRADSLYYAGRRDSAIVTGNLALRRAQEAFGVGDSSSADVMNRLGVYQTDNRNYAEADSLLNRALRIRTRVFGPESEKTSATLLNLGLLYMAERSWPLAKRYARESLAIKEKLHGTQSDKMTTSLKLLGDIYLKMAMFDTAEVYLSRVVQIRERVPGPDNPKTASALNSLATVFYEKGEFYKAEPLYRRAITIISKTTGAQSPEYAGCLYNLGILYMWRSEYCKAEPLLKSALKIRHELRSSDPQDVRSSLTQLAILYSYEGDYAQSEHYYLGALQIKEQNDTIAAAVAATKLLNGLGVIYTNQGRYEKAEESLTHSVDLEKKLFGDTLNYDVLCNLARLYDRQRRYKEAESLFKAIDRKLSLLGPVYYSVATSLGDLAMLYRMQNRMVEAGPLLARAFRITQTSFEANAPFMSEAEALDYSRDFRASVDRFLSYHFDLHRHDSTTLDVAGNTIAACKGQISDWVFARRRATVIEGDSTTTALAKALRSVRYQVYKHLTDGPGKDVLEFTAKRDSLNGAANELEAELARRSSSFVKSKESQEVTIERIVSNLPGNSMLIEYLRFSYVGRGSDRSTPHYLAMVLDAKHISAITDLGEASRIDKMIQRYRVNILRVATQQHMPLEADKKEYAEIGRSLYRMLIDPIAPSLPRNVKLLFIAPDGALDLVSFASLVDSAGEYLIARCPIHYLSAARDVIRLKQADEPGSGLFALGDPAYGSRTSGSPDNVPANEHGRGGNREAFRTWNDLRKGTVSPLPGSRAEINQIVKLWKTTSNESVLIFLGSQATKQNFLSRAPGNRIIHLATHGYYLRSEGSRQIQGERAKTGTSCGEEDPLMLSGLLFAGANRHLEPSDSTGIDDGVASAQDVTALNLIGTDLVVLSACESGLGDVRDWEGVYGLRRSFQMAGARTIISALWPVSDERTANMMSALYGRSSESLPRKMREMQLGQIRELRKKGLSDHPYAWAGFIASGDWRTRP